MEQSMSIQFGTSHRCDRIVDAGAWHYLDFTLKNITYMKQRFTLKAVLFVAALLTGLHVYAYSFEADGIYYQINYEDNSTVSVTYNDEVEYTGAIVIPSTVTHDGTTYTVTNIGYRAFDSSSIVSVDMPNSITDISSRAFFDCSLLTEIVIPESVTTIGSEAFLGCSGINKPVVIPDGVVEIPFALFSDCTNLPSLTIGANIKYITTGALNGCSNLKELIIEDSDEPLVIQWGNNANSVIDKYTGLETAYVGRNFGDTDISGELRSGLGLINAPSLKSVTFGEKVTAIYASSAWNCTNLETVSFGSNLMLIDYGAFSGTSKLTSIEFPNTLKSIGDAAFDRSGITGELVLPDGLESIGESAFNECTGISGDLVLPINLKTIGKSSFYGCTGITGVVLPDALTSLGKEAFSGCSALSSLTIGTALPEFSLTSIKDCTGLKEVIFKDSEIPITVDGSEVNTPYNIETAHIGRDISVVMNGFGLYGLFQNCVTLRNVTIGDKVTALSDYAFDGCTGLTSIDIPDSVTKIGSSAFSGCTGLTSLTLPDGVTDIGYSTFSTSGLKSIVCPIG